MQTPGDDSALETSTPKKKTGANKKAKNGEIQVKQEEQVRHIQLFVSSSVLEDDVLIFIEFRICGCSTRDLRGRFTS